MAYSTRSFATLTALALTFGVPMVQATAAFANPNQPNAQLMAREGDSKGKPGRSGEGWLQKLNLTPDQLQRIKTIRQQTRTQIEQQQVAMKQAQQELQKMLGDGSSAQLRDKFQQMQTLRQQLATTQFNSMLSIREVLTPEQRRQFAEQMQRQVGGRERMGGGGGDREQSK